MRICSICKIEMYEGYLAEEFSKTYCSPRCLDKGFYKGLSDVISATPDEEMDDLTIFWTEWEYSEE